MELLIAFEMHGGMMQRPINERAAIDMAMPSMSTIQLLDAFKKIVRFILETCSDDIDARLFHTSFVNGTRLRAVAIHQALPSVDCIPIWSSEVAYMITKAVIKQKGKMTAAMLADHEKGVLELPWSNLNLKGTPRYRAITSRGPTHALRCHIANHASGNHTDQSSQNLLEYSDHFACPKCFAYRSVSKCSLLVTSGWGHILCFNCRVTSRSMTWQCKCKVLWHTCTVHSSRIRIIEEMPTATSTQIVLS